MSCPKTRSSAAQRCSSRSLFGQLSCALIFTIPRLYHSQYCLRLSSRFSSASKAWNPAILGSHSIPLASRLLEPFFDSFVHYSFTSCLQFRSLNFTSPLFYAFWTSSETSLCHRRRLHSCDLTCDVVLLRWSGECAQTYRFCTRHDNTQRHSTQDHRRGRNGSQESHTHKQLSCQRQNSPISMYYRFGERARISNKTTDQIRSFPEYHVTTDLCHFLTL